MPVVIEKGKGVFVYDVEGKRYFDALSAYSALNQGHCHPKIVAAAAKQLKTLTLTSRAFHNVLMGPFLKKICELTRMDKALLMNSGAEAVETSIKAMRQWGYVSKGIRGHAEIIVAQGNFHGRTTTIVGFSSDPSAYKNFGPATPGFVKVPYGLASALEKAITPNTCGFLIEPIQGEAGAKMPPAGYLKAAREICKKNNVLFCADEIQTGLGRTGKLFCVEHDSVEPDLLIMGKALSGGFYPISAVAGKAEILDLFAPGTHGSTFGGNPLACAIGLAALEVIVKERLPQKALEIGGYFKSKLKTLSHPSLLEVRGLGLLLAIEFKKPVAKDFCKALMKNGVLAKETHETTVRLAPPLIITRKQVDDLFSRISKSLTGF